MRLTQWYRDGIMTRMREALIEPRKEKLREAEYELAELCRRAWLGKRRVELDALPRDLVQTDYLIHVVLPGNDRQALRFGPSCLELPCYYHRAHAYDPTPALRAKVLAWRKVEAAIREDKDTMYQTFRPVLNASNTLKKLIERWPEVQDFLPPEATAKQLPALSNKKVNKALANLRKAVKTI